MKDINFFEPYSGQKKEKLNFKIYIYGSISVALILVIGSLTFNSIRIFMLNKEIKSYNGKLAEPKIQEQLNEAERVNSQINILTQYNESLNDISMSVKQRDIVSDILLNNISSTVPSEVSFKNLNIEGNIINIQGVSTNRVAVAELEHNLKKLNNMQDVYVNSIDNSGAVENNYSFDIKCVLKDVG